MLKNLISGTGLPVAFSMTCGASGPCTWKRYIVWTRRQAAREPLERSLVALELDVVVAGRHVVLEPVADWRPADEAEPVRLEMKQDAVADHVAVVVARNELLCLVRREARERVHADVAEELERVGPFDVALHHVVALIEEHAALLPCALLVAPIRVLRRDHGIDVRRRLRVAQHVDGIAGRAQRLFQILVAHRVQ